MSTNFHSVKLDKTKCNGCTNCVRSCPTDAIRVREFEAIIKDEKCIDCGVCVQVCEENANYVLTDSLMELNNYDYNIVLPTAVLYGQFKAEYSPAKILAGLLELGFDDVWEVGVGVDILHAILLKFLEERPETSPLISATCPSVVRLIQVSFPEFLPNIIPLQEPMEILARTIKERKAKELGIPLDRIGIFYITSCSAKITAINAPLGLEDSYIDGAISVMDIYRPLIKFLNDVEANPKLQRASKKGVNWVISGGQKALCQKCNKSLAVDGIDNVISVLKELERGHLQEVEFFEFAACPGGCIGGPLNFKNRFISQSIIKDISEDLSKDGLSDLINKQKIINNYSQGKYSISKILKPSSCDRLDNNIKKAINKLDKLEKIEDKLPGLNCTACGAPSCRALAEDIINDSAQIEDCIIILKKKINKLSQQINDLV
ncbi:[Fe-Fe] hydrogenase large subunit C-terminal domain-containing protein [Selenihalanaerobacter shriftii]|uniref:Iron only hydrogenase large subunit, C-terminal domain n=1 Tax=Selenihalanaerobacter shriftii TaxID=142842 RepID=A0A1T4MK68_9FIRM|nr:[Fe-Fe] hydrogenase large subunit C-terminal domain-containing protein [Selenihalanaerobacter shriftii]SJZ67419.1 Iron only hydrogenase large subunit, C-terminal domain [Selenihalanaerobacter shriftii]